MAGNTIGVDGQAIAVGGSVVGGDKTTLTDDHSITIHHKPPTKRAVSGRMNLQKIDERLKAIDDRLEKIDNAVRGDDYNASEPGLVRTVAAQGSEQKLQRRELNQLRLQVRWLFLAVVLEPVLLYFVIVLSKGWWQS